MDDVSKRHGRRLLASGERELSSSTVRPSIQRNCVSKNENVSVCVSEQIGKDRRSNRMGKIVVTFVPGTHLKVSMLEIVLRFKEGIVNRYVDLQGR